MYKYCQGPKCHTYQTQDRKRGPKGAKYFQTRIVGRYGYGDSHFCTQSCWSDWWIVHGTAAVDHFGRLREPIKLTEENAWVKTCDYHWDADDDNFRFFNKLTNENIPLTQLQYNDKSYTIERHRQYGKR